MPITRPILALSLLAASIVGTLPVQAASFDCEKADLAADEKVICDTRVLNDQDVKMVTTFEILTQLLAMGATDTLRTEQSGWLKQRQACGADAACIGKSYDERMIRLNEAFSAITKPL